MLPLNFWPRSAVKWEEGNECCLWNTSEKQDFQLKGGTPMNFLNSGKGYDLFAEEARKKFYVDKTMLIDAVYRHAQENNPYICVTRPRRFGKSTAVNMVAAFF